MASKTNKKVEESVDLSMIQYGERPVGHGGAGRASKYPWEALRAAFKAFSSNGAVAAKEPYFVAGDGVTAKQMAGAIQARRQKMKKQNKTERYSYRPITYTTQDEDGNDIEVSEIRVYVDA